LRRKGIETLIKAFSVISKDFPNYTLVIVGEAPQIDYERALRALVQSKNLGDKIVFAGILDSKDVASCFEAALFVALPSLYSFSASAVYAVSLAFEKPVVAPRIGFLKETIFDGSDGLLYDAENAESFAKALRRMITDPALAEQMKVALKEKRKNFKPSLIARQTLNLYSEICGVKNIQR